MEKEYITIISGGHFEKDVLRVISEDITREFHYPVIQQVYSFDLSCYYHPSRRQYDANGILKEVLEISPPDSIKSIGLFRVDLFIPILTYIFGQAFLNGNTGIASLFRLKNELYGLEQNYPLLIDRFRKVIIHELGHTFGLIHCPYPNCVMRSSTYVEDLDQKKNCFCKNCQEELNRMRGLELMTGR